MSIYVTVTYAEKLFVASQALHAKILSVNIQKNIVLQLILCTDSKAPRSAMKKKKKDAEYTATV